MHLSQPTLSRQLKDLEEELGKQLLIRGNRRVTLTEEGMILRKRAEEIMELVRRAENEISLSDEPIAGDITLGAAETDAIRFFTKAAQAVQKKYPLVHFHIISGDKTTVVEALEKGLIDFGLVFGTVDKTKYESMDLPYKDRWGVLMRRDSPLAQKEALTPKDLWGKPLILSRQAFHDTDLKRVLSGTTKEINIVATYNLLFNGSLMVDEGMGYAICLDKIINVSGDGNLCFRPFVPTHEAALSIIWKKYQIFTKAAEKFLQEMQKTI